MLLMNHRSPDDPSCRYLAHSPTVLSYEAWALGFQELVTARLTSDPTRRSGPDQPITCAKLQSARGLLLYTLAPVPAFDAEEDPLDNPPLPAAVSTVKTAKIETATGLLEELFVALFDAADAPVVYALPRNEPGEKADVLGRFAVIVLWTAGRSDESRKVLHEGEWRLTDLVADNFEELRGLYGRLRAAVEDG